MGISVSRVGGNAQPKAMKKVAGKLRLDLSQYRELEAFAQFGSELDADTQATLHRGERLVESLNQDELKPWKPADQVAAIYSGTAGYLDRIKVERVREFHEQMLSRLHSEQSDLMEKIGNGDWDDSIEEALGKEIADAIDDFGPDFDEELHADRGGRVGPDHVARRSATRPPARRRRTRTRSSDDEPSREEKEEAGGTA